VTRGASGRRDDSHRPARNQSVEATNRPWIRSSDRHWLDSAAAGRPGAWTGAPGRRLRRDLRGLVLEFSGIAGDLHQNSAARKSVGEQPELELGANAAYPSFPCDFDFDFVGVSN